MIFFGLEFFSKCPKKLGRISYGRIIEAFIYDNNQSDKRQVEFVIKE